jgi:molybdate transport system substrate-binding protein
MTRAQKNLLFFALVCCILCSALVLAGCTSTSPISPGPDTPTGTPSPSVPVGTSAPEKTLVAFTAASLKGASDRIGPAFTQANPGITVKFNLDGTQVLKQQVENGARPDIFISASNTYTNALKSEGYLINDTVKPLTSNYIIIILPAANPGGITSLADLGVPGKKIAMGTAEVPVGINTRQVIDKLANSTFNSTWKDTLYSNVKTYETTEPGVVTKVSLGEVDAGIVYESSYKSAKPGTLISLPIPVKDNALQTYSIGVTTMTPNRDSAQKFEDFMLSAQGQQILSDFGFRPVSSG